MDWSKLKPNLPWLVDAGGCVLLDTFVSFCKLFTFRANTSYLLYVLSLNPKAGIYAHPRSELICNWEGYVWCLTIFQDKMTGPWNLTKDYCAPYCHISYSFSQCFRFICISPSIHAYIPIKSWLVASFASRELHYSALDVPFWKVYWSFGSYCTVCRYPWPSITDYSSVSLFPLLEATRSWWAWQCW